MYQISEVTELAVSYFVWEERLYGGCLCQLNDVLLVL